MGEKTVALRKTTSLKLRDFTVLSRSVGQFSVKARLWERLLHLFTDVSNPRKNLGSLLDATMEAIPSDAGSVLLMDPVRLDYVFVAARGPVAAKVLKIRLAPGQGIVGAAMLGKHVLAVSDVTKEPRFAADISKALGFPTRSILASPVIHQGDVLGAVELVNKQGDDVWTGPEIEMLERASRVAGCLVKLAPK